MAIPWAAQQWQPETHTPARQKVARAALGGQRWRYRASAKQWNKAGGAWGARTCGPTGRCRNRRGRRGGCWRRPIPCRSTGHSNPSTKGEFGPQSPNTYASTRTGMHLESALRVREILIVNAHEEAREVLAQLLGSSGVHVQVATSGYEALGLMSLRLRPVAIIDEDLSDFNFADLSVHLKAMAEADWAEARCVTIALVADRSSPSGALSCFDQVLRKPLDYVVLQALLEEIFGDLAKGPKVR